MTKMLQTISNLVAATRDTEEKLHPEKLTYVRIVEALEGSGVSERDILSDLRKVLLVDLAIGTHRVLDGGGPGHPDKTLRYEGPLAAVKLFRNVVQALAELEEEAHREQKDLGKPFRSGVVEEDDG